MKRTKHINLGSMRKKARFFSLAPLALAVISGCAPEPKGQVKFVTDIDDCTAHTSLTQEQCRAVYQDAVEEAQRTAPRFGNARDCQAEFGNCESNGSGYFVPIMAGYLISELIDETGDVLEAKYKRRNNNPVFRYEKKGSYHNKIMTADGSVVGSSGRRTYFVKEDTLKPKPKATKTLSRGGFGSKAASKSSWGSKSSSRGGWGG